MKRQSAIGFVLLALGLGGPWLWAVLLSLAMNNRIGTIIQSRIVPKVLTVLGYERFAMMREGPALLPRGPRDERLI